MCLTTKNFGSQEEKSTYPNRRERPLPVIMKMGWGTTERDGDRWIARERKREGGCSAL